MFSASLLRVVVCLALATPAFGAAVLPVRNPGFEADSAVPGNFDVTPGYPQGWTPYDPHMILDGALDAVGILYPAGTTFYSVPAPEGHQVGIIFLSGNTGTSQEVGLQQTLTASLEPNTTYTLRVAVGNIASGTGLPPSDVYGFFNLAGFPGYAMELRAGGQVLAADTNSLGALIPDGQFATGTVQAVIGNAHPALGQSLQIRLINLNLPGSPAAPGIEVNFDDVRLTAERAAPQASRFALRFFGTGTGQIDRVKIPIEPHNAADVGGDFTVDFWVRPTTGMNQGSVSADANGDGWIEGNIVVDRDVYGNGDWGDYGIALGRSGSDLVAGFGLSRGAAGRTIVGTRDLEDGLWHHVAAVREQSTGVMRLYVDGILDAQGTGPTGDVSYRDGRATSYPDSDPFLVLAAEKHDAGAQHPSFHGWLDEVRVWSTALSSQEIARVAGQVLNAAEEPGLENVWRFEEGAGQVVTHSASGPDGVLMSGVAGNGEWSSWRVGGVAAPVAAPALRIGEASPGDATLDLAWFGLLNFRYTVQSFDPAALASWAAHGSYTNLPGSDAATGVSIEPGAATSVFYRVIAEPYR